MPARVVFLDRDGVINRNAPEGEYILTPEEIHILPDVPEAIKRLNELGFKVVVVTNQRCVALGQIKEKGIDRLHDHMRAELEKEGAVIDEIFYCPHSLEEDCFCRKPQPGMILAGLQKYKAKNEDCFLVGDSQRDIKAARLAGVTPILIRDSEDGPTFKSTWQVSSLSEAVKKIEREA